MRSKAGGRISLVGDKPWHGEFGNLAVPPDSNDWTTLSCEVKPKTGVETLWIVSNGNEGELFEIDLNCKERKLVEK